MDYTLTLHLPFDDIIHNLTSGLQRHKLQTQLSFSACLPPTSSGDSQQCPCRYAVLLVFTKDRRDYRTITIYGQAAETWLTLVWQPARPGQDPTAHEALEVLLLGTLLNLAQPLPGTG